ncbi:MAG: FIST N-terminal domain-containing protein [Chthoniobacteraceae bacterium]
MSAISNRAVSRLHAGPFSEKAVTDLAHDALAEIGGKVTCGFVFVSSGYAPNLRDFLELIQLHAHVPMLAGCSGSGLLGAGREEESAEGFTLLLLHLPQTQVHAVRLPAVGEHDELTPGAMRALASRGGAECAEWIVVANPFSLAVEPWLDAWNTAFPGVPAIGGLASGGQRGDTAFVFLDRELVEGGVAIGFSGGVKVHALVSQGCRPVGEPFTITGAEGHLVTSLGSRPAFEALDATFGSLPPEDKALAQGNLFVGLAMSEYIEEFKTGDFLVRNLIGGDPQAGVLAVGALPRVGQTLQFQLRDRASADAEMRHLLADAKAKGAQPFASLVFSCAGRGRHLFGEPHHDARVLAEILGEHASAGFFCNGEIGPVAARNFIHGYTAALALFS